VVRAFLDTQDAFQAFSGQHADHGGEWVLEGLP
jgi:hypothetical protein